MALTRRGPIEPPRLSKLANLQQVAERQEAFNREVLGLVTGLPAGFGAAVLPLAVEGGAAASKGQETSGWAAAGHRHALNVAGSPGTVETISAQGNGPGVSLSGHTHRFGLLTTKGDFVGYDGSTPVRVPVGSDGFVPIGDATAAVGWRWTRLDHLTDLANVQGGSASERYHLTSAQHGIAIDPQIQRGGVYINPVGALAVTAWRAPYACTVLNVRGYRSGGTGATINARKNGTSTHLASDLSLTSDVTWMDGGAVQNATYAAGDSLELLLQSVTGLPAQVVVQVDFRRD
jgi:hypothetical protein